jgi:hypothetical protein
MRLTIAAVAALLLAPAAAHAQFEDRELDVELNFGIGGFTGDIGGLTSTGPAYGVIAGVEQTPIIKYEVGYMGQTTGVHDSDGRLTSNKLQANVRAGPELEAPIPWQPYAFGGVGANFVIATTDAHGLSNAVQGVIPFGVGADFFTDSPIRVGARGTYDWTPGIGSDVAPDAEHPDEWKATINASAVF